MKYKLLHFSSLTMRLSEYELDITKELINIALANAADAFSKMTNEKVLVQHFHLTLIEPTEIKCLLPDAADEMLYVLTTDVKGSLEGKSYLVFNTTDTARIFNIFAPNQGVLTDGGLSDLQQALLLELDNILSAAVITQLSNLLGLATYGDVPGLRKLSNHQALACFAQETGHFDVIFHIHARFKSYQTNIQPAFVWFFKSDFLQAIQQLVQNKKQLSLLKNTLIKV